MFHILLIFLYSVVSLVASPLLDRNTNTQPLEVNTEPDLCRDIYTPTGCYCVSAKEKILMCAEIPDEISLPIDHIIFTSLNYIGRTFQADQPIAGGESIESITFQKSSITQLGPSAFASFPNLKELDLSGVDLVKIHSLSFQNLPKLENLALNDNKITQESLHSLTYLNASLINLNIKNNAISRLGRAEVSSLEKLQVVRYLLFSGNPIPCDCDLYFFLSWILRATIAFSFSTEPNCYESQEMTMVSLIKSLAHCRNLNKPFITNVTARSCHSLYIYWEFNPHFYQNDAEISYRVAFKTDQSVRTVKTTTNKIIVNGLPSDVLHTVSIIAEINNLNSVNKTFESEEYPVKITQYYQDGQMHTCFGQRGRPMLTWHLTFATCSVLVMILIVLIGAILCTALSAFVCKKRSGLTPTPHEPRPAYGHEPRTGNAAALLTYAHLDFEGPRTSSDTLKRQIINTAGVIVVDPKHIACCSVLLTGKFGTMFEGSAVMVRQNQYHCQVTVIEFSQRRLFERVGAKLTELSSLSHPNVLNVLAVVDTATNGPLTLLFDHLVDYLDVKTFLHQVLRGTANYGPSNPLETKSLIISQVAAGMKYLSQKQFVHGDLAARNIIFTKNRQVKISLTGAGIDLYPRDYLRAAGGRNLPIRWMSPECIQYGTCSSHSDVWSMGVLMWEVFSNGVLPYSFILDTEFVAASIASKGSLLKQPKECPKEMWNIMKECWIGEPMSRINFDTIETRLLKDVWNVSVLEKENSHNSSNIVDHEAVVQYQVMLNKLHVTSVLGLTPEAETDDENISANTTNHSRLPSHWV